MAYWTNYLKIWCLLCASPAFSRTGDFRGQLRTRNMTRKTIIHDKTFVADSMVLQLKSTLIQWDYIYSIANVIVFHLLFFIWFTVSYSLYCLSILHTIRSSVFTSSLLKKKKPHTHSRTGIITFFFYNYVVLYFSL